MSLHFPDDTREHVSLWLLFNKHLPSETQTIETLPALKLHAQSFGRIETIFAN